MARLLIILLLATGSLIGGKAVPRQCSAVEFTTTLNSGDSFHRKLGNLVFRINPTRDKSFCYGWTFSLEDAAGHDFIYPVNPPLRFNPLQFLGCSYGLPARESLEMSRSMRFVLSEADYLQFYPLVRNVLWPANVPDPEQAADRYLKTLDTVKTGMLQLKVVHFALSEDGNIRSAQLKVDIVAPPPVHFDATLKPSPVPCSAVSAQ